MKAGNRQSKFRPGLTMTGKIRLTALIPDSCWANIIIMAIIRGCLREDVLTISFSEIVLTDFMLSFSDLISSTSWWTSTRPLNQVKALTALSSSSLSNKRNFGDSGQNGNVASCKNPGITVRNKSQGHPASFPRTPCIPRIWDSKIEMVMISWYTVPTCQGSDIARTRQ